MGNHPLKGDKKMDFGTNIDIGAFAQTAFNAREARKIDNSKKK